MSLSNGSSSTSSAQSASGGYSAQVRLRLQIAGHELRLRQVGHDRIILRDADFPTEISKELTGVIIMTVDGVEDRWPVHLATPLREGRLVGDSRIVSLLPSSP
jgi:hypothetical protein